MAKVLVFLSFALLVAVATAVPAKTNTPVGTSGGTGTFDQCKKSCEINYHLNPVCGTDGESYPNADILRCYNSCGKSVQVASKGFCPKDLPKSQRGQ